MNVLKAVYCNQYYELKPKGKAKAAQANGTGLVTVALVLNFFFVMSVLAFVFPDFGEGIADLVDSIFGRRSARSTGRLMGLLPFLVFYPLIWWTMGRDEFYQSLITVFEAQTAEQQAQISKRGLQFFMISLALGISSIVFMLMA